MMPGSEHIIEIHLDIRTEYRSLVDHFFWDISCPDNNTQEFAA